EMTREYRLSFNSGDIDWDDPIPPEVTSDVLGRRMTCTISRTSLLAWSLMTVAEVHVADLAPGGWIKIVVGTGDDFDERAFKSEIARVLAAVSAVPGDRPAEPPAFTLLGYVPGIAPPRPLPFVVIPGLAKREPGTHDRVRRRD
ncbi:MAG TPA: hypothetical protein VHN20_05605, partial [Beijerinckiaceae bacterium]|nr:hypothetical protein [Beijerinckiaceae bacterium]